MFVAISPHLVKFTLEEDCCSENRKSCGSNPYIIGSPVHVFTSDSACGSVHGADSISGLTKKLVTLSDWIESCLAEVVAVAAKRVTQSANLLETHALLTHSLIHFARATCFALWPPKCFPRNPADHLPHNEW